LAINGEKWHFLVIALSVEEVEFTVYVRKSGRVTVPKEVRDALDIKKGNLVKCKIKKVNMG
jgi:AbrB family looped-hinge helix DNA binding protein